MLLLTFYKKEEEKEKKKKKTLASSAKKTEAEKPNPLSARVAPKNFSEVRRERKVRNEVK